MNSSEDKLGRKEIFNKLRAICNTSILRKQQPKTLSGISVDEYQTLEPYVSQFLGCSLQTLRRAIWWQRGALPVDLVLKVQNVIGEPIISTKDITDAFAKKAKTVKEFTKKYPFTPPKLG